MGKRKIAMAALLGLLLAAGLLLASCGDVCANNNKCKAVVGGTTCNSSKCNVKAPIAESGATCNCG
ncbi:MAG: hypothetical protein LBS82_01260 [Spirochaetaceae bacterium]|jgi:hypothetical protein|nr:hypothetical protein [Spirochaetaceae bacterium]